LLVQVKLVGKLGKLLWLKGRVGDNTEKRPRVCSPIRQRNIVKIVGLLFVPIETKHLYTEHQVFAYTVLM